MASLQNPRGLESCERGTFRRSVTPEGAVICASFNNPKIDRFVLQLQQAMIIHSQDLLV